MDIHMKMYSLPLSLFVTFTCVSVFLCEVIQIQQGKISGTRLKTLFKNTAYFAYKGIPFAEPPTTETRFTAPVPHKGWSGIYKADEEKDACLQFNHNIKKGQSFGQYGTEDCLYLNVYTPSIEKDKELPVLVFLFNDRFKNSYNISQDYAPDFFIEEEVIVVTTNHRLTMFGFLSLENEVRPGNAGIKDVLLTLKWIQDNIGHFGGDPDRVTLMGTHGGAALVDILLYSERAKHLFSGVIMQSGTALQSTYFQSNLKDRALRLAEIFGKTSNVKTVLNTLNKASVSDILAEELRVAPTEYFREEHRTVLAFGPVVEHDSNEAVITNLPENETFRIAVPMMIGYNSREGIEGALQYLIEPNYLTYIEKDFPFILPIRTSFRFDQNSVVKAIDEVKNVYFTHGRVKISKPSEYITYIGDVLTMYPIDASVRNHLNVSKEPIYYFNFDYSGSLNENKMNMLKLSQVEDGTWGAASGDELCYLFMCQDLKKSYINLRDRDATEIIVLRKMIRLWANFAKYRNPTPHDDDILGALKWDPVTTEKYNYLNIREHFIMRSNPHVRRFNFWDEFIDKYSKLAEDGVVTGHVKDEL